MPRRKVDLSEQPGNLTYALAQIMKSGQLKSATNPVELARQLVSLAGEYRGSGLSEDHYNEFVDTVKQLQNNLAGLAQYVTYYVLVGSGNGSIDKRFRFGGNPYESIDAIADVISEGTTRVVLSEDQLSMLNTTYATEFPSRYVVTIMPKHGGIVRRGFDDIVEAKLHLQECSLNSVNVAGIAYGRDGNNVGIFLS